MRFSLFGKKPEDGSLKSGSSGDRPSLTFEEQLANGYYLGILETYDVKWTQEKVSRDILQNFFDPQKTLKGTSISTSSNIDGESLANSTTIRVSSDNEFDFVKLLHLGGSTKTKDQTTAGGFGEGSKIAALVLLRDYGCKKVSYASKDWTLEFFLQPPPQDSYDVDSVRGLHVRLTKGKPIKGNFIEIETTDPELAREMQASRDFFYHPGNPDFESPTFTKKFEDGSEFGFRVLPGSSDSPFFGSFDKGNYYDAGQRRHYDSESGGWNQVEGLHIWTIGAKSFGEDRDRGAVSKRDFEEKFITPTVEKLSTEECERIINELEAAWPISSSYSTSAIAKLLEAASKKLGREGVRLSFPETHLAVDGFTPMYITEALRGAGYTLCRGHLAEIGMVSASAHFKSLQSHLRTDPGNKHLERCSILQEAAKVILGEQSQDQLKEIWVYSQENEKNIIQGQYDEAFVWLSAETLEKPFFNALATYLHELDHKYGSDQSAEFSYALTRTLERVIEAYDSNYDILSKLKSGWENSLS